MELIEKVVSIKDIDYIRYHEEKESGIKSYSDEIIKEIITHHPYKYSTITTLDELLNRYSIKNNLINIYKENYKNALQK